MNRLDLGPNGALKYCIETLCENKDWLLQKIVDNKDTYIIIDCPGELFYHYKHVTAKLQWENSLENGLKIKRAFVKTIEIS